MIHVCVVGTRGHLSTVQFFWLMSELKYIHNMGELSEPPVYNAETGSPALVTLHHDDLTGTVRQAHEFALYKGWKIVAHPLLDDASRAHLVRASKTLRRRGARDRIEFLMKRCSIILAVPKTPLMKLDHGNMGKGGVAGAQSYTWMVVLAALEAGKDVRVCPTEDW